MATSCDSEALQTPSRIRGSFGKKKNECKKRNDNMECLSATNMSEPLLSKFVI